MINPVSTCKVPEGKSKSHPGQDALPIRQPYPKTTRFAQPHSDDANMCVETHRAYCVEEIFVPAAFSTDVPSPHSLNVLTSCH